MENRSQKITYKDKEIIYGDYSNLQGEEFLKAIEDQENESFSSVNKNLLHLLNFTDSSMTSEARERADQMIKNLEEKGYSIKTACFGITGIQKIIASAVKKDMYFGKDEIDAKEWLVSEEKI